MESFYLVKSCLYFLNPAYVQVSLKEICANLQFSKSVMRLDDEVFKITQRKLKIREK